MIAEHKDRGGASIGTVFTAIDNTSVTPISGTFVNLADGSIFAVGSNTFQVSYEGGDGNDLTLMVMPLRRSRSMDANLAWRAREGTNVTRFVSL